MSLDLQVELPGGAQIKLNGLKRGSSVAALKTRIEQRAGILPHTYRLTYLDTAPLEDRKTLHDLDIVGGALLRGVAWRLWQELVAATLRGDAKRCHQELRTMGDKGDERWRLYCAWCTLFTGAHSGHYVLLSELLKAWPTLAVNAQSPNGRTALHAAASMGRWKVVCVLLDHGADVSVRDGQGRLAAELAQSNGHRRCEQSLRFCEWNIKKWKVVQQRRLDFDADRERCAGSRRAHQFSDSRNSVWLSGPRGPEYLLHTPNPVSLTHVTTSSSAEAKLPQVTPTPNVGRGATFDYSWFDKLRAQQLVPNTHQILTYSDPSSTSLQPRSLLNPNGYLTPPSLHRTKQ